MTPRHLPLAVFIGALFATAAQAQTNFPEVEPNSQKSEATPVFGITAGDTISGSSTGLGTVLGDGGSATADVFRVRTSAAPLGIYRHRLTLSTSTTTLHTGSIRGLNQTGTAGTSSTGGTPGTVDSEVQLSSTTTTPPRFNQWYGFGKQEEIYYRVIGTTTTTAAYTATMSTSAAPLTVISQAFESASMITISTVGQTTTDTMLHVYDSNLNALPGYSNDDEGPVGPSLQSRLIRSYAPGTYYLAVGTFNTAWNFPAPPDEDFQTGLLMDFPDSLVRSSSSTTLTNMNFLISSSNGTLPVQASLPAGSPYDILWVQFTAAPGAPPIVVPPPANDNCAAAISVGTGTTAGTVIGATNDGVATCDTGGVTSRDVWYTYTNAMATVRLLTATTCGTTGITDSVLSLHNSCGGAELACSDDCGGTPCAGPAACITGFALNPGQMVWIRVSDKGLGGTGNFSLVISEAAVPPPPPVNDLCSAPIVLPGPGTYPFDTTAATSGQGTTGACGSPPNKNLWYQYTASTNGTLTVSTCGGTIGSPNNDTEIWLYSGAGCPAGPSIACNDDAGSTLCPAPGSTLNSVVSTAVTCGQVIMIELGNFSTTATVNIVGTFSVTEVGSTCDTPSTPFCLGDGTGAPCPCGNTGAAGHGCGSNAFAGGAILSSNGIAGASPGTDTLVLTASDIPGPGLFFQSNGLLATPANFGDGHLCAAVGIIRLGVVFPTSGVASYPGGLTPNPIHIQGGATNGQTKHYQCWYRSVPGLCGPNNYDLTQGLTLVWGP